MKNNEIQLRNAGIREHDFAQKLVREGMFPKDVSFKDVLDHGVYDTSRDVIVLTFGGVCHEYPVK